jgi:ATP-dependent Clp protease ATP-binding subunit ClpA
MRPKADGALRAVIADLAKASGAYIIVSGSASTSDVALTNRRTAMAEAVSKCCDSSKLMLDFYDRSRIATWVREHAGLVTWVRSKIGKAIPGWRAYESWSYRPEGADATYLVDTTARIRTGDEDEGDGISATEGINKMRDILRVPGHVVRLVGLSGVGKTRLVEALFELAVGHLEQ